MIDEIKAALEKATSGPRPWSETVRVLIEQAPAWLEHLIERVESAEREAERVTRAAEIELEKFAGIGSRIQYRNDELVEENAKLRAELAEAVEVIEFYGHSEYVDVRNRHWGGSGLFPEEVIEEDDGKRARAYLASRKENKG